MLRVPGYQITAAPVEGKGKYLEVQALRLYGGLKEGCSARLYPGNRELRIKAIKPGIHSDTLTVKGVGRSRLQTGMVMCSSDWPVVEAREALFLSDGQPPPSESELVRGGLCPDFNKERLIGRASLKPDGPYVSFHFPAPYPLLPGTQCSILDKNERTRRFTLLWPGVPTNVERKKLDAISRRRPQSHPEPKEIYARLLHLRGFVALPPPLLDESWEGALQAESWVILENHSARLDRLILKASSKPGGSEAASLTLGEFPKALCMARAAALVKEGRLLERGGWFFPPGDPPLSPFHRSMLDAVRKAGEDGLRIASLKDTSRREAMETLARSGLLYGGKEIWLSAEAYQALGKRLLTDLSPGDRVPVALARERLGGSRPLLMEILQALELNGRLSPDDDGMGRRFLA